MENWTKERYEAFREELLSQGEEKYKEFNAKLLCSELDVIGLRAPFLRKIAAQLAKEDGKGFLQFCGKSTVMTRSVDEAIYSPGMETLRQKKSSDLKNRVAMANQLKEGVLISIHQNALPQSPAVHGAQVFYNAVSGAEEIAIQIQQQLNEVINLHKAKECKPIPDSIYLMKHTEIPAVLVECGFLSNGEETILLRQAAHQKKLSLASAAGIGKEEGSA